MTIKQLRQARHLLEKLAPISRKISTMDINSCDRELTEREEKHLTDLCEQAQKIAREFGLYIYHQGDPRGSSLYLGDKRLTEKNYNQGFAI